MPWELVFNIGNFWVIPFWLLLAFGPRNELTGRLVFYGGVGPVALCYALLLPLLMTGVVDPVGTAEDASFFAGLPGVMAMLSSKGGVTVGWLHYLAFDLFVGLWIARNADGRGIARWIQAIFLFFTLMAGPFGLTLYLMLRGLLTKTAVYGSLPH